MRLEAALGSRSDDGALRGARGDWLRLTGTQRPEHPIQAAIGSSWQVFTVCDPCQEWANVNVDQPFLDDDFILELRSRHDIRDQRHGAGRRVASPLSRGHTPRTCTSSLTRIGNRTYLVAGSCKAQECARSRPPVVIGCVSGLHGAGEPRASRQASRGARVYVAQPSISHANIQPAALESRVTGSASGA